MDQADSDLIERPSIAGMLTEADAIANLAVRDIAVARRFYEGTLGFEPVDREGEELIVYRSGNTVFNIYRSDFAGTNEATAMTWVVGDRLESVAERLAAKGIAFLHYDLPGMTRDGDIHVAGDMKVAWFKDPDHNILNIVSG